MTLNINEVVCYQVLFHMAQMIRFAVKGGSPFILREGTHPKSPAGLHAAADKHTVARLKDVQGARQVREGHHTRKDGQLHLVIDPNPMRGTWKEHRIT